MTNTKLPLIMGQMLSSLVDKPMAYVVEQETSLWMSFAKGLSTLMHTG